MTILHENIIQLTVNLAAAPLQAAGFGSVIFIAEDIAGFADSEVRSYTSFESAQADADLAATAALNAVQTAYQQDVQPAVYKIGNMNTASNTYADILPTLTDQDFFGLTIESRAAADQELMSISVEASSRRLLFCYQSLEADILTTGFPGNLVDTQNKKKTYGIYHDVVGTYADVASVTSRLVADPDVRSAGFRGNLGGVVGYATELTAGQIAFAEGNNFNLVLGFGNKTTYLSKGVNMEGRQISEIVSQAWFEARLEERLTRVILEKDALFEKIIVNFEGHALVRKEIFAQYDLGVAAEHFLVDQINLDPIPDPIPQADLDAAEIKVNGKVQLATNALAFPITITLTRSAVN